MKAILEHFSVKCGTCGKGLMGEQHWFEAPAIIVHCSNSECPEVGAKWKLPINRVELERFEDAGA